MRPAVALIATLAVWAAAAPAQAADLTIDFDNLADETELTNQYNTSTNNGVRFGVPGPGFTENSTVRVQQVGAGQSASPPNVAEAQQSPTNEFCADKTTLWAKFEVGRRKVALKLSVPTDAQSSVQATAVGYAADGALVAIASVPLTPNASPKAVSLTADAAEPPIVFVRVQRSSSPNPPCGDHMRIDDLTFEDLTGQPTPPADFLLGLDQPSGEVGLLQGQSEDVRLRVTRLNGSSGPIRFSVGGLPDGVTASFPDGNPTAGDKVRVRLTATEDATLTTDAPITVTGDPQGNAAVGPSSRTTQFSLDVLSLFDARITGIEVTQGVQNEYESCGFPNACASVPSLTPLTFNRLPFYTGVRLVTNKRTAVRVFANVSSGSAPNTGVLVRGFRNGKELEDSPLVGSQRDLVPGLEHVTYVERTSPGSSWDLELPLSWTLGAGNLELRAELITPYSYLGPGPAECSTDKCKANNVVTLRDIEFIPTGFLRLYGVRITHAGEIYDGNDVSVGAGSAAIRPWPVEVLLIAQRLLPLQEGGLEHPPLFYYRVPRRNHCRPRATPTRRATAHSPMLRTRGRR